MTTDGFVDQSAVLRAFDGSPGIQIVVRSSDQRVVAANRGARELLRRELLDVRLAELRDPGILRLFFGGDPKRLGETQLSTHRQRLAELESLAEAIEGDPQVPRGFRLTVQAGLGHEREWVRFWELLEQGEEP